MTTEKDLGNIAETVARESRKPMPMLAVTPALGGEVHHIALPQGYTLSSIDTEALLPAPRQAKGTATLIDADSFCEFVKRHATGGTVAWCHFDPTSNALLFTAVLDDHAKGAPGWRRLQASYKPALSVEFGRWNGKSGQAMPQLEFAEFIERNQDDIASAEGFPDSLAMLKMATEFEASADMRLKSHIRLQSGGGKFEFVDEHNAETIQRMELFNKFALGLPVFRNADAYRVEARLRFRTNAGKLMFTYELMRADKVVEHASRELIAKVKAGLGSVPMLLGGFQGSTQ